MLAFVGPRPEDREIAHWNGDRADNRLVNLRYATKSENALDRVRHGCVGDKHPSWKEVCSRGHLLTPDQRAGKRRTCRTCRTIRVQQWKSRNPERAKELSRNQKAKAKARAWLASQETQESHRGLAT
jgi:hypothetical protein